MIGIATRFSLFLATIIFGYIGLKTDNWFNSLLCGLIMGADGGIGTTYNVMPEWYVKLFDAFKKGDLVTAQEYQFKCNRVTDALIRHSKFGAIRATKAALRIKGFDVGGAVYPAKEFNDDMLAALKQELSVLGIEF